MKKPTQKQAVVNYMDKFGSIPPREAVSDLGIYRLAAVIHDLKKAGYPIMTELVTMKTQYGYKTFARYSFDNDGRGKRR